MSARQDAQAKLIAKATTDPNFRAALISDPNTTISTEIGAIPDGITITVIEETPQQVFVVLPPDLPDRNELSDDQLTAASGGNDLHGGRTECVWGSTCQPQSVIGNC